MNIRERSEHLARRIVQANAIPYSVAGAEFQQSKVLADATEQVFAEMKALELEIIARFNVKFEK